MDTPVGILVLVDDRTLASDIDRVVAAAGLQVVWAEEPIPRRVWAGAAAVLLNGAAAHRCAQQGLPRRARVVLVSPNEAGQPDWIAAVAVGAQQVVTLPTQDRELMAALADAAELCRDRVVRGRVITVCASRGGAGASVFAAALAYSAPESLLVDGDPFSGGLDLVLGAEAEPGLRWPELSAAGGRLSYAALRQALPRRGGVSLLTGTRVLSGDESSNDIDPRALNAVLDAGSRGGATVICDVPRRPSAATETALATADLVVLVVPADVRSCAAAAAAARWVAAGNPNTGVVVRGPAPGGLRAADVARIVGLPVLAAMRPQPGIDTQLDSGGLRMRPRSPLSKAAGRVLALVDQNPQLERVAELVA